MTFQNPFGQPLLTFPELDKSPLSIRAKALVFIDPRSQQLREELEHLAPQPLPVLIRGETGTGKELLARQIHRASDRSGLFVSVNCAAISPTYADAELFGYSAGSQGGTASSRAGWFGSANGGTLYLDEIADLPLAIQGKLLAALENREVTRVERAAAATGGRAPGGRYQYRPGAGSARRALQRAPVPVPARGVAGAAATARAARRYPAVGRVLRGHLQRAPATACAAGERGGAAGAGGTPMARQHP